MVLGANGIESKNFVAMEMRLSELILVRFTRCFAPIYTCAILFVGKLVKNYLVEIRIIFGVRHKLNCVVGREKRKTNHKPTRHNAIANRPKSLKMHAQFRIRAYVFAQPVAVTRRPSIRERAFLPTVHGREG